MKGAFYHFSTGDPDDAEGKRQAGKGETYYGRTPSSRDHLRQTGREYVHELDPFGIVDGFESQPVAEVSSCITHPEHTRTIRTKYLWIAEGDDLSPFVPSLGMIAGEAVLVRGDVAQQLRRIPFTGYTLVETQPYDSQGRPRKLSYPVFIIEFMGKRCDKIIVSKEVPNKCPFCGYGPIVCSMCRFRHSSCPKCGREYAGREKQFDGKWKYVNRLEGLFKDEYLTLVGRDWDGSDFHGGGGDNPRYVSKRVLDWLLSIHAAPFGITPVTVETEGMTNEQLAKLETMKMLPGK